MKRYIATSAQPPWGRFHQSQKTRVYDAIKASGADGIGRHDIAKAVSLPVDRIGMYVSVLTRAGLVASLSDPSNVTTQMDYRSALLAALVGLEVALVVRVREKGKTSEMDHAFARYQKVKEHALRPGNEHEGTSALKIATVELVKLIL